MSEPSSGTGRGGRFVDRLGELVLLAYATGRPVEGTWYFVYDQSMVPDFTVDVVRTGDRSSTSSGDGTVVGTDRRDFQEQLESFVLFEFGEGEDVVGSWVLSYDAEELPTWVVDIQFDELGAGQDAGDPSMRAGDGE